MRLLRIAVACLLATVGLTIALGQGTPAHAAGRTPCDITKDGGAFKRGAFTSTPNVIAQIRVYSFAPGYRRTVTREVSTTNRYQAGAKIGGSLNTTVGNRFISQAEVSLHADFEASGEWSTDPKTTVTDVVVNTSRQNASFVFYRGSAKRVTAPVYVSVCRDDDGGSTRFGHIYWAKVGTFKTFTAPSAGALRCGAGTTNIDSVGRRALAIGCA